MRNESDFGIAVAVGMSAAGKDGRINPSGSRIVQIENVVHLGGKDNLLHGLADRQRVAEVDVAGAVAWQLAVVAFRIVNILLRYEIGVPRGFKPFLVERDETVQDGRWREGKR